MPKHFNTAGPVEVADHYTVPLLSRMDWAGIRTLDDKIYTRPLADNITLWGA